MKDQINPPAPFGSESVARLILLLCAWLAAGASQAASPGAVVAWGNNSSGQTTVPVAAQSGVVTIAAGGNHTVALKTNGSVIAWGRNGYGQTTLPLAAQSGVVAIAAGEAHTVVLKSDGSVVAWGAGTTNAGDGVNYGQSLVPVAAQSGVAAIAAGWYHTVALKSDGSVVVWGLGESNVPVAAQSGVMAIAAGGGHTVALVIATALVITSPPVSETVNAGEPASFTVVATGLYLSYQWRQDGTNLSAATNVSYRLSNAWFNDAGSYTVAVTNSLGSVTSAPPAVLTVNAVPPSIARAPQSVTSVVGGNVSFSVVAGGTGPFLYQWLFNSHEISGATNSMLMFTNVQLSDAGAYVVIVKNDFGSVTSAVAQVTMTIGGPLDHWSFRDSPTPSDLFGITYGQGIFVAVGYSGAILTSTNGVTWADRSVAASSHFHGVTFGNGLFVAVGKSGVILTSPDGAVWTSRVSGTTSPLNEISYGNCGYVAVGGTGGDGILLCSADGVIWFKLRDLVATENLNSIAFGGIVDGSVVVSDGRSGESFILSSRNNWDACGSGTPKNLRGVAYGNRTFVIVGNDGTILEWCECGPPDTATGCLSTNNLRGVTYGNGVFTAVGNLGTILTSTNGHIWTCRNSRTINNLHSVAYGNGTFVAVGNAATIAQSGSFLPGSLTVRSHPIADGFEVAVTGEIGRTYRVQANSDLATTNWIDLFSFENTQSDTTLFLDSRAGNFRRRFYRLVSP